MTRRPFRVDSERKIVAAGVSAAVKRCSPHGSATKGRARVEVARIMCRARYEDAVGLLFLQTDRHTYKLLDDLQR